jgi:hypothetical protein
MQLSSVQDHAIAARMALVVGAITFNRCSSACRLMRLAGDLLYVFAKDEEAAAEMEERFALHISIFAKDILKREINVVLVLPNQLAR